MFRIFLLTTLFWGCAQHPFHDDLTYQVGSTMWMQNAAEVKALDIQAFNLARASLDSELRKKRRRKPLAVVLDIDETVLDNSPYQAYGIAHQVRYNKEDWGEWINNRSAKALSGVADFIAYAQKRRVEVFLISNRRIKYLDATHDNLVKQGIKVKKQNIFLKTQTNSKLARRQEIEKKYQIVILMGDTLADFHEDFEEASQKERALLVEKYKKEFGIKYFILPNPMYGEWEGAIYKYDYAKTNSERKKIRTKHIYPYR
jgi:5'-nucleotidase (lipoprotein e(P4) family)